MSKRAVKRYVVWKWRSPWVYTTWSACEKQIRWYPWARYKSFGSKQEAQEAYEMWLDYNADRTGPIHERIKLWEIKSESICVDAACKWNPWALERRGVLTSSWKQLFRSNIYYQWTVNVWEYIVLLQGIKRCLDSFHHDRTVYTDSRTALSRVRSWSHRSQLNRTHTNSPLKHVLDQRELRAQQYRADIDTIDLQKRNTRERGEIVADFWRK